MPDRVQPGRGGGRGAGRRRQRQPAGAASQAGTRAVRAAGKLADIFGRGRVWVELQRHWLPDDGRLNAGLVEVARAAGLPLVATNDVHYATVEEHRLRDILLATQDLITLTELAGRPGTHNSTEFCLKSAAEMGRLFADLPGALAATQAIAERCQVSLDFSGRRTPAFPRQAPDFPAGIPPDETAFSYLYGLCHQGLRDKFRPVTPQAVRQLAHELSVIEAVGLADYFLIVWDIVRHAREEGIRCQGRGSAANSLVAYVLGITPVDPLRHNLLFERFLSDRTDTMPDIDIDFAVGPPGRGDPVCLRALRDRTRGDGVQRGHVPVAAGGSRRGACAGFFARGREPGERRAARAVGCAPIRYVGRTHPGTGEYPDTR